MDFHLTREQLLADLHQAYLDARRHKRQKPYQQHFERRAEENLRQLCDELWTRSYRPQPSTCFIITDPKRREVFAAQFRDRVVHHLYYNYVHEMLERTFIHDSYSCIRHRGTHYGIARLERHIRRESQNYQEACYVLKMDISGYFMHIDRRRPLDITLCQLRRMAAHRVGAGKPRWRELVDMDFVEYLTRTIILLDPTHDCRRYVSRATLRRMEGKVAALARQADAPFRLRSTLNSLLGLLCHYRSYRLRRRLFFTLPGAHRHGYFQQGMRRYVLYPGRNRITTKL